MQINTRQFIESDQTYLLSHEEACTRLGHGASAHALLRFPERCCNQAAASIDDRMFEKEPCGTRKPVYHLEELASQKYATLF